jgi:hypothetical protein
MTYERGIVKDLEGIGRGLIGVLFLHLLLGMRKAMKYILQDI